MESSQWSQSHIKSHSEIILSYLKISYLTITFYWSTEGWNLDKGFLVTSFSIDEKWSWFLYEKSGSWFFLRVGGFVSSSCLSMPHCFWKYSDCLFLVDFGWFGFLLLFVLFSFSFLIYSPLSPFLPAPHPFTPLLFPFRKGQAFHGHQPNIAYQVSVRLHNSPHIKAGYSNPVERIGPTKQAKESETIPIPTVRSSTRKTRYTTKTYMQRT